MTKPKLTYFDAPVSRGEECRLALHLAGVDFHDNRLKREDWPALKPKTPFGSLPLLEIPGKPVLAQSNAILVFVGRKHGLHPKDDFDAAYHESVMHSVEDLRAAVGPSLRIEDPAEKKKVRERLAATTIPEWGARAERLIEKGPFFAGEKLHVVDIKLYSIVRWFTNGVLDHIPSNVFADLPKLTGVHDAVREHPGVKAWYAKR
ncbi:MAG TPA: glutathione S-transferase [Polyangiaceae bacterium]|nr:glutathione S-transferase [Polyangiaceae bacterium]